MVGRVVSVKMQNTAVILVEEPKTHPLYKKAFTRSKKYMADDPVGVKLGDVVEVVKIRPISKNKHWQVKKVLGTDIVALGTEALKEEAAEAIAEVLPEATEEETMDAEVDIVAPQEPKEDKKAKPAKKGAKK